MYAYTRLRQGDEIDLLLPGITNVIGTQAEFMVAWKSVWESNGQSINTVRLAQASWTEYTLTVHNNLEPMSKTFVTLAMSLGFKLPELGNRKKNPALIIFTTKPIGSVPAISIQISTPVGTFARSELKFNGEHYVCISVDCTVC